MRSRRRWSLGFSAVTVAVLAAAALWFWPGVGIGGKGTPRLAVDRSEIDAGAVAFDAPARVTFVLTNAGDGPLTIKETPRVRAVQGC